MKEEEWVLAVGVFRHLVLGVRSPDYLSMEPRWRVAADVVEERVWNEVGGCGRR